MALSFDPTACNDFVGAWSVWILTFLDLDGGGGPWTFHREGNTECSLDWRGRGRGMGGAGRKREEVKIFN